MILNIRERWYKYIWRIDRETLYQQGCPSIQGIIEGNSRDHNVSYCHAKLFGLDKGHPERTYGINTNPPQIIK